MHVRARARVCVLNRTDCSLEEIMGLNLWPDPQSLGTLTPPHPDCTQLKVNACF